MVYVIALELLWLFSCPEECHGFPCFGHRYSGAGSRQVIWYVFHRAFFLPYVNDLLLDSPSVTHLPLWVYLANT